MIQLSDIESWHQHSPHFANAFVNAGTVVFKPKVGLQLSHDAQQDGGRATQVEGHDCAGSFVERCSQRGMLVFQRGHVWPLTVRQKLIKNILLGKPIPAIFLYKEATGSKYTYNILDGKQRLESIILFISNERGDWSIPKWTRYFFADKQRKDAGFVVQMPQGKVAFSALEDAAIRELREYSIPTIEITLNDESTLDDMISLFVDINQYGVKVNRFDIVKAMGRNDPLLLDVFGLIAQEQRRGEDIFYRTKRTPFTNILRCMNIIEKLAEQKSQVDRMWERLLEIVLFYRTKKHRKPVEILKSFISKPDHPSPRLKPAEAEELRGVFKFLGRAYKEAGLGKLRLATDQTHFYSMVTSIIAGNLLSKYSPEVLMGKLVAFSKILEEKVTIPDDDPLAIHFRVYRSTAAKQTTDVSRRETRQKEFLAAVEAL